MDNQHQKITGYRDLSQQEIDLMNRVKAHAEEAAVLHDAIIRHIRKQFDATSPDNAPSIPIFCVGSMTTAQIDEYNRLKRAEPYRWLAIGQTDLQTGYMALVRAIAQPSTF